MVYPELSRRFLIRPQEGNVELAATVWVLMMQNHNQIIIKERNSSKKQKL